MHEHTMFTKKKLFYPPPNTKTTLSQLTSPTELIKIEQLCFFFYFFSCNIPLFLIYQFPKQYNSIDKTRISQFYYSLDLSVTY